MGEMLKHIIGEDIDLKTSLSANLWGVKVDPTQIEQVVANLVVNARDVMPQGGRLTIETANVVLDKKYVATHLGTLPGEYVLLAVSDTGFGMSKEVQTHIFEPFFTTKEKGKGTGLGLSTVYGIVNQTGGNIRVFSEPGKGTTFKIYFPRVEEPSDQSAEKKKDDLPRGTETILVVEDEAEVRKVAMRILVGQGYKVLETSDGYETLRLCEELKEPLHLILTDLVMPGMNGHELVSLLEPLHPSVKVLYMSGYSNSDIPDLDDLKKGMNYIQKPFTMEDLVKKVREVLDS
jgi:CheY-like chemotaxis protein